MSAIPSYDKISAGFREDLSRLAPLDAYLSLHKTGRLLAESVEAEITDGRSTIRRDPAALKWLNPAYKAYSRRDFVLARRAVEALIAGGRLDFDPSSLADALHLLGRLEFDEGHQQQAEERFQQVLQICQQALGAREN